MGKWVEVKCNCPNRIAQRLDPEKRWVVTYVCGHADGCVLQFWPGFLHEMACLLKGLLKNHPELLQRFKTFSKLESWPRVDEYLPIPFQEVVAFQIELEELLKLDDGTSAFPYEGFRKWHDHWVQSLGDQPDPDDPKSAREIIESGLRLCRAAFETHSPIEFYW